MCLCTPTQSTRLRGPSTFLTCKIATVICLMASFMYYSQVAKEELSRECDYELEAANQKCFRNLLSDLEGFYVPMVVDDISSKRVLTTELVSGNY